MSLNRIPKKIGWYLSGFVDGEGSFNVSLRKKSDYSVGWQPVLSFNVSQREQTLLLLMKQHFGCGIIKRRSDGLYSYDVTNPRDITDNVIPFFETYRFLSNNKNRNFELFKQVVKIMSDKEHLDPDGFIRLLLLREELNQGRGRTRKYSIDDVLESSETIRQAYENRMI